MAAEGSQAEAFYDNVVATAMKKCSKNYSLVGCCSCYDWLVVELS